MILVFDPRLRCSSCLMAKGGKMTDVTSVLGDVGGKACGEGVGSGGGGVYLSFSRTFMNPMAIFE